MGIEVLASEETPLGLICLRRRVECGRSAHEITLDHRFLMSSLVTASERALAERAVALHARAGLRVLVGGLGLGYTAHSALASPKVAEVEVVELLPAVIGWLERGLIPLAAELLGEARLSLVQGDVYRRLLEPPTRLYDAVLVDVDTSPEQRLGDASHTFYTRAGLSAAGRHLAPEGVLGLWSFAESPLLEDALRAVFERVLVEPVSFANEMLGDVETNWLYFAKVE